MATLYVTYPGGADTPFDRKHWIDVHFPLGRECWGPYGLERAHGFFPPDDGGGLLAVGVCVFRGEAAMHAALASPATARVMADVERVTALAPQRSLAVPL